LLEICNREATDRWTLVCLSLQVKPQTVSNLLWAYATLGWAPTHLLNSLAVETLRQLPYFKPQELANTLWAYATLGYTPMPEWLGQMGVTCEGQVGGCKPQELSSLIWALGSLRYHPGAAFLRTATEAANRWLTNHLTLLTQQLSRALLAMTLLSKNATVHAMPNRNSMDHHV